MRAQSWTIAPSLRKRSAVGDRCGVGVVGDHDDRLAHSLDRAAQQAQHLVAGARVEVAGGLVGEEHRGARRRAPGRRPRAAAGRRRARPAVGQAVAQADGVDELLAPTRSSALRPAIVSGSTMFSCAVSDRQQVEGLEDEADLVAAQLGELALLEVGDLGAVEDDAALGRLVEAGEDVHEGRLARARRAHDRRQPPAGEVDVDAAQGLHGGVSRTVRATHAAGDDDRPVGSECGVPVAAL